MASKKGINNNNLKQENRGLVLKMIATGECYTRIELAKRTGLTKMSISNIIGEFIEQGIICEKETEIVEGQGRNPIRLYIADKAPKIIGLDIHRAECVAVLSDLKLNVLKERRCSLTKTNSQDLFGVIFKLLDEVMQGTDEAELLGIGVGCSGPLDIKSGVILNPPDFYGLHDLNVMSAIKEHYDLPVYIDSQYNCAALAERFYGAGRELRDFIFVGIMRGIGSGIITDGGIFHNANGYTSELGHVSIDYNGNKCPCGNRGCLETYTGSEIIRDLLIAETGMKKSFQEFCEMAEHKETSTSVIDNIFEEMMERLACALTSGVNMFNSEAIIIGHEGFFIPERFLKYLEELINVRKIAGKYRHVAVVKSAFKDEAHILGCACPVLNRVFEGKRTLVRKSFAI